MDKEREDSHNAVTDERKQKSVYQKETLMA